MTELAATTTGKTGFDQIDRGLLGTLLDLREERGGPVATRVIAAAVGVPDEFERFVAFRLEQNRLRGYVALDGEGRWLPTPAGIAAAAR